MGHVVDTGEPSPEDFSMSRSTRRVASLEEVRLNRDAFPGDVGTHSDCVFVSCWPVQL